MEVGGSSDWPQNSIDHTFGCFGAKFNFQVLSMSADLAGNSLPHMGLSSMPFWSKYKDPPTFMKCGINIWKMLTLVLQLLMKLKIRILI